MYMGDFCVSRGPPTVPLTHEFCVRWGPSVLGKLLRPNDRFTSKIIDVRNSAIVLHNITQIHFKWGVRGIEVCSKWRRCIFSLVFMGVARTCNKSHKSLSFKRIYTYIRYTYSPNNAVSTSATSAVFTYPPPWLVLFSLLYFWIFSSKSWHYSHLSDNHGGWNKR